MGRALCWETLWEGETHCAGGLPGGGGICVVPPDKLEHLAREQWGTVCVGEAQGGR